MIIMRYLITAALLLAVQCGLPGQKPVPAAEEVFLTSEVPPLFLEGCEDVADEAERKRCSDFALNNFIYRHIEFSLFQKYQFANSLFVVLSFVIEKDGGISNIKVVWDNSDGSLGLEIERAAARINSDSAGFQPGTMYGKPVAVRYHMPFRICLE